MVSKKAGNKGKQRKEAQEDSDTYGIGKDSEEYRRIRERNNLAVKRSRTRSKLKTEQTLERVNHLRQENALLEEKITLLSKELGFLKDLFLAHAGSVHGMNLEGIDLHALLKDSSETVASGVKIERADASDADEEDEDEAAAGERIRRLQDGERLRL